MSKPGLELRTKADLDRLRRQFSRLHSADPANFPSTPSKGIPELPTDLPTGWSVDDFLGSEGVDVGAALSVQESWSEQLAFYRSPRRADSDSHPWASTKHSSDWGIYLHSAGVERLARKVYLPIGFDHAESLSLATQDLLNHELQHAALDITALRLEAATGPSMELGRHDCPTCLNEEALCHAAVARAALKRADEAKTRGNNRHWWAWVMLQAWLTAGPPGYCEWRKATSEDARDQLITEVLEHDGVSPIIGLALYKDTEDHIFISDVPLHLVMTPGSAAASGKWKYTL
jgi:hypothetical protein